LENEGQAERVGRIVIVAFWIVSLIVALFLTSIFLHLFFTSSNNRISPNWAGYSVASDFADPQPVIVGMNGSWTVPTVSVSQRNVFSAIWIGIGGVFDNTLIQTGTEQDSNHGNVMYSAWYELLPNGSVTITTISVSAGDEITASISLINSTTNMWSIEMADVNNGQSFQRNVVYNSSRLSAEWIVERPTLNYQVEPLGPLADFGSVTFTNSRITTNTSAGTIGNFPSVRFIMQNLVTVSSLSSNGSSFTVTYLSGAGTTQSMMNEVLRDKIAATSQKRILITCRFHFIFSEGP
jgi:hypothetical protein